MSQTTPVSSSNCLVLEGNNEIITVLRKPCPRLITVSEGVTEEGTLKTITIIVREEVMINSM